MLEFWVPFLLNVIVPFTISMSFVLVVIVPELV